ncbi:hypothetical protein JSY14_07725 [Brachybacterium sp. EF45031]|uniref:hypothetical protein n=1 Tax=Brachybacterium sillae TaxID=2810536 RepID=UPI00217CD226|nr:hypothetical protein [Brachybacterium sillae]MCS6711909.1 hypothetical protein [Brachybacterium sillae]
MALIKRPTPPHLRPGSPTVTPAPAPDGSAAPAPRPRADAPTPGGIAGASASSTSSRRTLLLGGGAIAAAVLVTAGVGVTARRDTAGDDGSRATPGQTGPAGIADVDAAEALSWAVDHQLLSPDAGEDPSVNLTRADLALALHTLVGRPVPPTTVPTPVTDLPQTTAPAAALRWLHAHGGLLVDAEFRLRPQEPIRAGEAVAAIAALAREALPAPRTERDVDANPDTAWAIALGLLRPEDPSDEDPLDRAHAAAWLHRLVQRCAESS